MDREIFGKMMERKFLLSLFVQVTATAMVGFGKLSGEQWANISMFNLGGFTLGNISEQFARKE